jgi:hypothetical protein
MHNYYMTIKIVKHIYTCRTLTEVLQLSRGIREPLIIYNNMLRCEIETKKTKLPQSRCDDFSICF